MCQSNGALNVRDLCTQGRHAHVRANVDAALLDNLLMRKKEQEELILALVCSSEFSLKHTLRFRCTLHHGAECSHSLISLSYHFLWC